MANHRKNLKAIGLALALLAPGAGYAAPVCMEAMLVGTKGTVRLSVALASEENERAQGLMGRISMPMNHGMLFVFPTDDRHAFWMHNTTIPLDIVPLGANGNVLETLNGVPMSQTPLVPAEPIRRVLEVNAGLIASMGAEAPNGRFALIGGIGCEGILPEPQTEAIHGNDPGP